MSHAKQLRLISCNGCNGRHRLQAGGTLRNQSAGRGVRPLSSKHALHVVFKLSIEAHRRGLRHPLTYSLVRAVITQYARRFFVKLEQVSIQGDHIHLLIRASRRSLFHNFFRVVAGQIAQRVTGTSTKGKKRPKFWKYRPFSRVVESWRGLLTVRDYIRLNESEALGLAPYRKQRLRGMTSQEIKLLLETIEPLCDRAEGAGEPR